MIAVKKVSVGNTPLPLATAACEALIRKLASTALTTWRLLSLRKRSRPEAVMSASVKPRIFQMAVCTSPKLNWPLYLPSAVKFCASTQLIRSTWVWVIAEKPMGVYEAARLPA